MIWERESKTNLTLAWRFMKDRFIQVCVLFHHFLPLLAFPRDFLLKQKLKKEGSMKSTTTEILRGWKKKIMKAETSNHHHHLRWHQEIDKFFKQRLSEERKCRLYLDISHRVHTLIFHTCFLNERGYLGGGCLY